MLRFFTFSRWSVLSLTAASFLSFLFNPIGVLHLRGDRDQKQYSIVAVDVDNAIPDCARDVFITLHGEKDKSASSCRGMLLRDDIILTSKECSRSSFTFDFPGSKGINLRAVPHKSVNKKKQLSNSRIGFLVVINPPTYYHFVDQPAPRNLMFLSLRSTPGTHGTEDNDGRAVAMTCTQDDKPIAHNFPINGELVSLGHLAHVLPHDILWEDMDIHTAYMLQHQSLRWYTRSIERDEEESTITELQKQRRGPRGSLSIPDAHEGDSIVPQLGALCEAIDPRGHRPGACFKNYYYRWSEHKPFSGMHFFDWLDYGPGMRLLETNDTEQMLIHSNSDKKCFKEDFNSAKVHYFNDDERREHAIDLTPSKDGTAVIGRYKMNGKLVRPTPRNIDHPDQYIPHLYMWNMNATFYVVGDSLDQVNYRLKHSGVMGGQPALGAGKIYFGKHGKLTGINYSSGHYRPTISTASMMYQWMGKQGLNVTSFQWIGRDKWSSKDICDEYDWDSVRVPGFTDAVVLKQSCLDVTTSPTWVLYEDN